MVRTRWPFPSASVWISRGAAAVLALLLAGLLPDPAAAQRDFRRLQQPTPPPYFAIQDARVVTVSGQTMDRATVVVEDGVITAVGRDVNVPARARVIDGSGLTVYPGMVNALSSWGHAAARGQSRGGGAGPGGGDRTYSTGPEERPASTPWVSAADGLDPEDERISEWRAAGFTSAVTAPTTGFFPGQAALINLAGFEGDDMVVAAPVGLHTTMSGGPGHAGYPNSILGVIAYFRQTFLDAAHYGDAWSAYESAPAGRSRPDYDRALAPIQESMQTGGPILMEAESATEIRRALMLAGEAGVRAVVYGAHEAYAAAADLANADAAVLLSLEFPKAAPNGDPEAEPTLQTLRLRERAPTSAAALAGAGVPFAFYTDGVRSPSDAMSAVRLVVAAGLDADDAVRALTLAPAEIFGVEDRLGSVEVGKIGNLVVTTGDLLAPDTRVRMVFVDGALVQQPAETLADASEDGEDSEGQDEGEGRDRAGANQPPEWTGVTPMTPTGPYLESDVWYIHGATIMTGTGETIENGQIVVRDGKIAEVGTDLDRPGGAREIDASGQWITPGIIDAHSHIAADGINEGSVNVSAMVGIEDVLDPEDVGIYRAAAGGVTTINLLHGSANPIGGKNAVLKMRWGQDADGLLVEGAPAGIKFALGENPSRTRTPARYPNSRMGVMDVIRQAFLDAQQYKADWEAYRAAADSDAIPPRRDLKLDALVEILDGERMVHAHSYRADEILQLVRLAEEFGFRISTFQHVLEGYRVADELAAHGAGASTFSDWWAYKVEAYEAIPHNAALMTERGVTVSINSDSGEEMRHLNQEAAKTMKWGGLDEHAALALITMNPARQLGIDDRVGSLEPGKDADLVIFDGHPLSNLSKVRQTMIDGAIYFDIDLDRDRQQQLEQEKQTLLDKQRTGEGRGGRVVSDRVAPVAPGGGR